MASSISQSQLGYDKSLWQRVSEATRAVEYAVKGVMIALDGRVGQRHNTRALAFELQHRGEDIGVAQLEQLRTDDKHEVDAYKLPTRQSRTRAWMKQGYCVVRDAGAEVGSSLVPKSP